MRLKSFHARNTADAIAQVRAQLGPDAIIVASREVAGGIQVTAAVEAAAGTPHPPAQADPPLAHPAPGSADHFLAILQGAAAPADPSAHPVLHRTAARAPAGMATVAAGEDPAALTERLHDALRRHGVGDPVRAHVVAAAARAEGDALARTIAGLRHVFLFQPVKERSTQAQPIAFVGPPGAGKTLAIAKLAAAAVLAGLTPAVITTDVIRAGGIEQLAAFTRILGVTLMTAEDGLSLCDAIDGVGPADLVLIDTAGRNPFHPGEMAELAQLLGPTLAEPVLTLAAGGDPVEAEEVAAAFASLGVRRMVATRVDTTRRLGSLLVAAGINGLAIANLANSPRVADGLPALTAGLLARLLLARNAAPTLITGPSGAPSGTTSGAAGGAAGGAPQAVRAAAAGAFHGR